MGVRCVVRHQLHTHWRGQPLVQRCELLHDALAVRLRRLHAMAIDAREHRGRVSVGGKGAGGVSHKG